jgi:hypothetical protein
MAKRQRLASSPALDEQSPEEYFLEDEVAEQLEISVGRFRNKLAGDVTRGEWPHGHPPFRKVGREKRFPKGLFWAWYRKTYALVEAG